MRSCRNTTTSTLGAPLLMVLAHLSCVISYRETKTSTLAVSLVLALAHFSRITSFGLLLIDPRFAVCGYGKGENLVPLTILGLSR